MNPERPRQNFRNGSRSRPRPCVPQRQPDSSAKVWIVLGCVVATGVGALLIWRNIVTSAPVAQDPADDSAMARAARDVADDRPLPLAGKLPEYDDLAPDDSLPALGLPSIDMERAARRAEVAEAAPQETAERRRVRVKAKPAPKVAAIPSEENRFFTLQLSGSIGGQPIDSNDQQTWARLSYFLSDEAPAKFYLVYPDGSIPHSVPTGPGAKVNPRKNAVSDSPPAGDSSRPDYRLVVESTVTSGNPVTFYGKILGSKFNCRMTCRVEKRNGADFALVEQAAVEEKSTPARGRGPDVDPVTYVRQMHDATLEKLVKKLQGLAVFRGQ